MLACAEADKLPGEVAPESELDGGSRLETRRTCRLPRHALNASGISKNIFTPLTDCRRSFGPGFSRAIRDGSSLPGRQRRIGRLW